MLSGNILDVYPDNKENVMVVWIVDKAKSVKIVDKYIPSFYVHSKREDLYKIAMILKDLPHVKNLNFTYEKILLGSNKKKLVLEVVPKKLEMLRKLAEQIDSWGGYYRYNFFNVDTRLSSRYLHDKGVFCNAHVKWDGKTFVTDDEQWAIDYDMPEYRAIKFDIERKSKSKIMSFDDPIKSIKLGNIIIGEGCEADTILLAVKQLNHADPDVVYTRKGDSVLFPYLFHRAKLHGIQKKVVLGRDQHKGLHPTKQAKSYFTYGQIVYRPAFYTLKGRAHIDTYNSFMYD